MELVRTRKFFLFCSLFFALTGSTSFAYQPQYFLKKEEVCPGGRLEKVEGNFKIVNITENVMRLDTEQVSTAEYSFQVFADRPFLRPGEEARIQFNGAF